MNNEEEQNQKTNIISRRLNTFNVIRKHLISFFPLNKNEILIRPGKLNIIFSKLIEKYFNDDNTIYSKTNKILSINDLDTLLESNCIKSSYNYRENVDTEPNKNTIIQKNISTNNENKNILNNKSNNKLIDVYEDLDLNLQYY